ncbi:MAG: dockerin type I domain-containing protein [Bacteroidetes bacterium]|nr:dockerin type I domain-containing protein [Bacteroidota bacterium]
MVNHTYDVYIDNQLLADNFAFYDSNFGLPETFYWGSTESWGTGWFDCIQIDSINPICQHSINGSVSYCNETGTPMNNTNINLLLNGQSVNQTISDQTGQFSFTGTPCETYTFSCSTTKPFGGVNSSDALSILKHFVQITTLTGISRKAADINGDGAVNATDALMVQRRFVGLLCCFPIGDWVWDYSPIPLVLSSDMSVNITAACTGDVNCSYVPPAKMESTIQVVQKDELAISRNLPFVLPIKVNNNLIFNSLSLIIPFDQERIQIIDVTSGMRDNFIWNVSDHQLKISWIGLKKQELETGDFLISLICQPLNNGWETRDKELISINPESEITDFNGSIIQTELTIPKLIINIENTMFVYPNPGNGVMNFHLSLSADFEVTISIFDNLGRKVSVPVEKVNMSKGDQTIHYENHSLIPGTYGYQVTMANGNESSVKRGFLIIER